MADTKQGVLMARERNMRKDWRQIRTAGGPRPQRSRKDEGVGWFSRGAGAGHTLRPGTGRGPLLHPGQLTGNGWL